MPSELEIIEADLDGELATSLLGRYYAELAARFPDGFDLERTVAAHAADLRPPSGCFLVVRLQGLAVGCGGVRKLDGTTGEIKRMWVDPAVRGRGIGRDLLAALEAAAARLGCARVRLDSCRHLPEAVRLYRSAGYRDVIAYNDNPYADLWLEKLLIEASSGGDNAQTGQ